MNKLITKGEADICLYMKILKEKGVLDKVYDVCSKIMEGYIMSDPDRDQGLYHHMYDQHLTGANCQYVISMLNLYGYKIAGWNVTNDIVVIHLNR